MWNRARYNEPRYNEIPIVMNTMQKFKPNPDIMNECYHATDVESETDASGDIYREWRGAWKNPKWRLINY